MAASNGRAGGAIGSGSGSRSSACRRLITAYDTATMSTASKPSPARGTKTEDPLRLVDVDHLRFYVGNARQSAFFYAHAFGFEVAQFADLTTGSRKEASYLLTQGNIRILL